ncbi:MAG: acyltransferase [Verrucomicrobiae bacterium]|nr:acyltransferase [Verrucomicrobiae bacterium]
MSKLEQLDGLRGLMAWWVVFAHLVSLTGNTGEYRVVDVIADGRTPVEVFMMLSGFVICFLFVVKGPKFAPYLVSRWFRLFPLFCVCLIVAYFLIGFERANWSSEFWSVDPELSSRYLGRIDKWRNEGPLYLFSALTLFGGCIPAIVLPNADRPFLPPTWSISLEWQFYLLAPLLIWFIKWRKMKFLLIPVLICALLPGEKWRIINDSFVLGFLKYFLIGGISFAWFRKDKNGEIPILTSIGCLLFAFIAGEVSLKIWAIVLAVVSVNVRGNSRLLGGLDRVLSSRPLRWLGAISYSTYLCHWLIITMYNYYHIVYAAKGWSCIQAGAYGLIVIPPLVLVFSIVLHYAVEQPGINLGRFISRKLWPTG